ncbi:MULTISPECIES: replication initiation protein [Aeromonas]|nr:MULTISPECIES: replication initiation protein [Aeromonas]EHK5557251.1 replication initiation protein [Escherichia coli]MBX9561155.1 DNA primase [Aeromonas hydrophila]EHZ8216187.1 replication initiation protein [Escherichia coli]EIM6092574.1 replication initiation protein [Escherichia coli]MBX9561166.1 DNA primase [Aeromonas hydrophila]
MVKPALQAAVFVDRIPRRPYCSDDPAQGLLIRPQATALAYRHIQHNPPPHVSCLVFDVDRKPHEQHWREGYHEWRERGLPAPHWISINPENGNYHLGYLLASPVARTSAAKLKPLRYLAAIEHVLARRLGADMGYVGLITKNPVHRDWWTTWHNHAPYPLDYLAEFCPDADLAAYSRRSRKEVGGLGRNVTVFDNVREWAYSAVRAYWRPNGYEAWADAVRAACESANAFGREQGGPLPVSEIKATAKSISRWVWNRFTPAGFSQVQAHRGAKGGRISKRPTKNGKARADLLPEVIKLKAQGYSNRDIAEDLQISAGSVSNYLRRDRE